MPTTPTTTDKKEPRKSTEPTEKPKSNLDPQTYGNKPPLKDPKPMVKQPDRYEMDDEE